MHKIDFFIVDHTPVGGVQRVTNQLIRLFNKNNISVDYLVSQRNKYTSPKLNYPIGIDYINLNTSKKELATQLKGVLVEKSIDKMIFSGDNMSVSLEVLKASQQCGCKAIPQYHGSPYAYLKKYIFWDDIKAKPILVFSYIWGKIQYPFKKRKLKKYILAAKEGVACVSYGSANELKNIFKKDKNIIDKIFTIHNPLSFELPENTSFVEKKEKRIVYLSRLEKKHKNSFLVVKTWEHLAHKYPDWSLDILGDGRIRAQMESYCNKRNIPNVNFHGMIDNVEDYLKKSSISILTSNCEGLSMSIVEAIIFNNALAITHADGGVSDLVVHEKTGLLSPKGNSLALANNIEHLIKNETLRKVYSEAAFQQLLPLKDEVIVDKWKKVFNLI